MSLGLPGARPPGSFEEQFPELLAVAYRVAFRILGDRDEAHDIAAETLSRAYARWTRVGSGAAEPWVVTVAGRAAIDVVRRAHTARRHLLSTTTTGTGEGQVDLRLDLQRALLALPRRQREVVILRYLADRSEREAATALGLSVGTVKSHSSRGLTALRQALSSRTEA